MSKALVSRSITVTIPFYHVDMMRIAWHGNYLKYFEDARCSLLDHIDYNYVAMEQSGYHWPIVDCRIKYIKPARFNHKIEVFADLSEYQNRLKIDYQVFDIATGDKLTKGHTVQVAVEMTSGEMQLVSPHCLVDKVEVLLAKAK
jgi:acyl-CoA thioester hydrolase